MAKPKWKFIIKPNGEVVVEGFNFKGSACINDIIYKLLHEKAVIEQETSKQNTDHEKPVENIYYVKN